MEHSDNNDPLTQVHEQEQYEFRYNFINKPWDDRTNKSKAGIILLLVSIFVVTMALVVNNFIIHYTSYYKNAQTDNNEKENCQLVKVEDFRYVARIHLKATQECICVGAVISYYLVLAQKKCLQKGSVRVYVGSPADPRCKKGFKISTVKQIVNENISKELVLFTVQDTMSYCAQAIKIGSTMRKVAMTFVVGRISRDERLLSRQPVLLQGPQCWCSGKVKSSNQYICIKTLVKCSMLVGDLLIQDDQLHGLASTSTIDATQKNVFCYTNVSSVEKAVEERQVVVLAFEP